MNASLLDGGLLARKIKETLLSRACALRSSRSQPLGLAVVTGEETSASTTYRRAALKACAEVGAVVEIHCLEAAGTAQALELMSSLCQDKGVDGILLDLPFPTSVDLPRLLEALPAEKDVEAACPESYGRFAMARSLGEFEARRLIAPPTALAVAELLKEARAPLRGKKAAVIGRSNVVGKPAAHLLSLMGVTVCLCHSGTADLEAEIRRADIVVAGAGKAGIVKGSWVKPGAIVIDAGINQEGGKLRGDVEFEEASKRAGWITPVPGGVGPVTTALLLANALTLAEGRGSGNPEGDQKSP
ncbi:MAG: bifunctional 5,10-methylenetetrahydrofolate dehydrogenase/5,10-methenyltetrahydrofolate cyclohydrolase [Elusimicrobia bacterium]|nr:bifunctional 5,10-methylenetetrahydrofolate dehydrogenase/5,10-methenyltetrahydrofolate cyclohydrolase [Elusimicrobiota bacterium]